ncbi:DNA replication and repair protein RecF [Zymomonas mobilis subsp. mobilis ZM4 = ATCC 31821]|uniref:DNA replication and repair protein RecF n=2 Tax=Zymomonas mobilis subsp. mobilis TaxID=120045 RepID=Q5NM52_ZYMMO|nr:DNA replication/repair protein RecF [Zymomonas mobilis]AAV90208.1 DNA replication and repair protein RecF [Zymomonas mobilis subsp. mobilis ZM4 = ATCC 31821]AEH63366.1 DNA replication and repair protein RecF [Zymomonas mobilis subsp. mobilis ATCC 10988]AVZ26412.1 DNA replication and repair protein RecF [Zymomonas mobilis subsp. mobilis]AVZ28299.1 DNA replication and repair protein RecF [Zymomonas mobilis subsp. mobilis]AVZ42744.1 DNA replication and repair protein RecF [Zymomonas mobilis su
MFISGLSLHDFRSHQQIRLQAEAGLVILTGENGVGKTNILEAISLLSPGRGFRGSPLPDLVRREGEGGFAISAKLHPLESSGRIDPVTIGIGLAPRASSRQVRVNGVTTSANALSEWLAILWLTPAMDRLFQEGASSRRRFLDRLTLTIFPSHARHYSRYEAAMRQRNKLLSDEKGYDPLWLDGLEQIMAEQATHILLARRQLVDLLSEEIAKQEDGLFAKADLALEEGVDSRDLVTHNSEEIMPLLQNIWQKSRTSDAAIGRTLQGVHRADLKVTHHAKAMPAAQSSTGEQKALLLGLVLAQVNLITEKNGQPPVLLLDEVAAHLDPSRRAILFDILRSKGGQVWMTGTEPSLFETAGEAACYFQLDKGEIISAF